MIGPEMDLRGVAEGCLIDLSAASSKSSLDVGKYSVFFLISGETEIVHLDLELLKVIVQFSKKREAFSNIAESL